jgi:hypothetical protein
VPRRRAAIIEDSRPLGPPTTALAEDTSPPAIERPSGRELATGLDLLFWGWLGLFVLPCLLAMAITCVSPAANLLASPVGAMVIISALVLCGVVLIIGMVLCCAAPVDSGARGCAQFALGLGLSSAVLAALLIGLPILGSGHLPLRHDAVELALLGCWGLVMCAGLAALLAWLIFQRRLAIFLDERPLAVRVVAYAVAYSVWIGGTAAIVWLHMVLPWLDGIFAVAPVLGWLLVLYPSQLYLLQRLRQAVRDSLGKTRIIP